MSVEQWSDLLFSEAGPRDGHAYGSVRAVNEDGSYMVQLNASNTLTRCAPFCSAMVGDRVKVIINANGKCDAIGRLGGEIGGGGEVVMTVNDASNYVAGRVFAHAGTNDPAGALLCDGRAVSRREYWELFDAIGTTYGTGDGSSTFNLPNIESRTIIGESDDYALGATGGEEKHTLTEDELPSLSGRFDVRNWTWGSGSNAPGAFWADGIASTATGESSGQDLLQYGNATGGTTRVSIDFGGNQPHKNMQPYIVMRYFITTGKGDPVSGINPADYVVEWGNTNGWRWEKWASGKAECWYSYKQNHSAANGTAFGSNYYSVSNIQFPFEFADAPSIQVTGNVGSQNSFVAYVKEPTTTSVNVEICTNTSGAQAVRVYVHLLGKWKDSPASGGTETIAPTIAERFEKLENEVPIASGTSGGWEWIKFASGLAICAGQKITNEASFGSWNGMPAYLTAEYYPFAFVGTPASFCTMRAAGQFSVTGYTYGDATQWRGVGYAGGAGNDCYWTMFAVGRWK